MAFVRRGRRGLRRRRRVRLSFRRRRVYRRRIRRRKERVTFKTYMVNATSAFEFKETTTGEVMYPSFSIADLGGHLPDYWYNMGFNQVKLVRIRYTILPIVHEPNYIDTVKNKNILMPTVLFTTIYNRDEFVDQFKLVKNATTQREYFVLQGAKDPKECIDPGWKYNWRPLSLTHSRTMIFRPKVMLSRTVNWADKCYTEGKLEDDKNVALRYPGNPWLPIRETMDNTCYPKAKGPVIAYSPYNIGTVNTQGQYIEARDDAGENLSKVANVGVETPRTLKFRVIIRYTVALRKHKY